LYNQRYLITFSSLTVPLIIQNFIQCGSKYWLTVTKELVYVKTHLKYPLMMAE
jgi:hypothetical protein